ncbi:MAG: isopenicillin N synthase family oxygenase [Phormidesmis priestleyi]|uniref:Isopenicillin N synthase family oxygenase n=1 Tax=Phormidesmis priestleyi TaxID=268141 RepID=A0A2W4XSA3_9CYAN|nr:MAG: isopenicillin N synthase family oxygenase [Phormidesmis priestleyi]
MTAQSLPVLDLKDFIEGQADSQSKQRSTKQPSKRSEAFVEALGAALSELGFFALVNHGVEQRMIDAAYGAAEAFFALPEAVKLQYEVANLKGQRGFTQFGKEHAKGSPAPDLKEFWHLGRSHPVSYPDNIWPREVPQFQPVMATLFQQLETCAHHLMQACAQYLQQPQNFFTEQVAEGQTILRVIHYPPILENQVLDNQAPASLRAAPHEDINLITLLCEATTPGLELLKPDGEWLPIHTDPGVIIVDTGDMLQSLSNGLLRSTTHRVINQSVNQTINQSVTQQPIPQTPIPQKIEQARSSRRFSMPFFVHPRPEFDLTPLPSCVARTSGNPQFPAQTAAQYLDQRLKEIGLA